MHTKHTLTIPALTASLLLGLTACGNSDNNDPIKSADSTPTHSTKHKTTPPSTSNSSTPNGKPTFHFPEDVKVKIEENKTGNPAKDKILQDHRYAMMAEQESLAKRNPEENFQRYWTGPAQIEYNSIFKDYRKHGEGITGVDRFYARKIESHTKRTAIVTFCDDQSKSFDKKMKTGKFDRTEPDLDSYLKVRQIVKKNRKNNWQVFHETVHQGDKKCRNLA